MSRIALALFAAVLTVSLFAGVLGEAKRMEDVDLRAMSVAIEDGRLYAGAGDWLYVFDVAEPLAPKRLGAVQGIGGCRQIAVQNGFVYVSTREYGLWIVDATDPSRPRIRSRFDCCELATGVDVAGDVCFLGQRQNGVEFIDVSDPDNPRHIAMRKTDESQSVKYRDGWLYSGDWGTGHVTVFDAHDMRNIRQTDYVELYGFGDGVWTDGGYLYASTGHHAKNRKVTGGIVTEEMKRFGGPKEGGGMGHGLDIFDIGDPAHPKRLGRVDFPPLYSRCGGDWWSPRTSGDLCFCSQTLNGLRVVDISDKTAPKLVDSWFLPFEGHSEVPSRTVSSVAVGNGAIYVAVNGGGLFVIPCTRARAVASDRGRPPVNVGYREAYPVDTAAWHVWKPHDVGQCRAVAVRGDVVYAACGDAGLYALQVLPGNAGFRELAKLPGHGQIYDASVRGDLLYTAEGRDGVGVYDVSGSPAAFVEKARLGRLSPNKALALNVWTPADGWLVASDRRGVMFYDVRKPGAFDFKLYVGGAPGWDRYLADLAVGNGRYVGYNAANTAFKWIDLEAKPKPAVSVETKVNRIYMTNAGCSFDGGRKLLASTRGGYHLLAPNEGDPADGGKWPLVMLPRPFPGEKIAMSGIPRADGNRVVFTCRGYRYAALYDLSDPQAPKLLDAWRFSGNPDIAAFHAGKVVIPCGYAGVLLQK